MRYVFSMIEREAALPSPSALRITGTPSQPQQLHGLLAFCQSSFEKWICPNIRRVHNGLKLLFQKTILSPGRAGLHFTFALSSANAE